MTKISSILITLLPFVWLQFFPQVTTKIIIYIFLIAFSIIFKWKYTIQICSLFLLQETYWHLMPLSMQSLPSLHFLFPVIAWLGFAKIFHWKNKLRWKFTADKLTWTLVILTSIISVIALSSWALWSDYLGFIEKTGKFFQQFSPLLVLLAFIPTLALVNAISEELFFRAIIQNTLINASIHKNISISLQALTFATAHYLAGFPNGTIGFLMTFIFGAMLGYLKERSNSITIPIIIHLIADLSILLLIYFLV